MKRPRATINTAESDGMTLSIIIPEKNEAPTYDEVESAGRAINPGAEILVVDDGSDDETAIQVDLSGATLIRNTIYLGKGAAF